MGSPMNIPNQVSTHSRLKAAGYGSTYGGFKPKVSTHSRLKAAGAYAVQAANYVIVSTHSRLKAAGSGTSVVLVCSKCFNTQPPEGGWLKSELKFWPITGFNTQPPEGGWLMLTLGDKASVVSTHSRLKAAGQWAAETLQHLAVSTHSRLKATGFGGAVRCYLFVCFNTQPPEGDWERPIYRHTQIKQFQHTAA